MIRVLVWLWAIAATVLNLTHVFAVSWWLVFAPLGTMIVLYTIIAVVAMIAAVKVLKSEDKFDNLWKKNSHR